MDHGLEGVEESHTWGIGDIEGLSLVVGWFVKRLLGVGHACMYNPMAMARFKCPDVIGIYAPWLREEDDFVYHIIHLSVLYLEVEY